MLMDWEALGRPPFDYNRVGNKFWICIATMRAELEYYKKTTDQADEGDYGKDGRRSRNHDYRKK